MNVHVFKKHWESLHEFGFFIFPLDIKKKTPPHYYRWKQNATNEYNILKQMARCYPRNNIGIATGIASGIFVIDLDGEEGIAEFKELCRYREMPPTPMVKTGGGGIHIFLKYPSVSTLSNTVKLIAPHVDTRGEGGYIVAPGSIHETGNEYTWILSPKEVSFQEIPNWILEMLGEKIKDDGKRRNAFKNRRFGANQGTYKEFRDFYNSMSRHYEYAEILSYIRPCVVKWLLDDMIGLSHRHRHMLACELMFVTDANGKHISFKDMHEYFWKKMHDYHYEMSQHQVESIGCKMMDAFGRWGQVKIDNELKICLKDKCPLYGYRC